MICPHSTLAYHIISSIDNGSEVSVVLEPDPVPCHYSQFLCVLVVQYNLVFTYINVN